MATTSEAAIEAADYLEYGKKTPMFGGERDGRRAARDAMLDRYAKAIRDLVGENADLLAGCKAMSEAFAVMPTGKIVCDSPAALRDALAIVGAAVSKAEGKV